MKVFLKWKQVLYFTIFLILPVTSCSVYKPMKVLEPETSLPESFSDGQSLPPIDRWWPELKNRELEELIDEALSENLTLRMAWARLDQARQLARIAGAGKYPGLEFGFSGQHQHTGGDLPPGYDESQNTFSASLTLGYQVDLWKKIENSRLASVFNFEAGREEEEDC